VLRGILSFGKKYLFGQAAARIIDSHADLRWGADKKVIAASSIPMASA